MRLLWITDPHLDHLRVVGAAGAFGEALRCEEQFDAVVVTGDIATADTLKGLLSEFAAPLMEEVYFILGNHDFYHGSIAGVRRTAASLHRLPELCWLDRAGVCVLNDQTALVGCGGWADAACGIPESRLIMIDWKQIKDFRDLGVTNYEIMVGVRKPFIEKTQRLAKAAVRKVRPVLDEALKLRQDVIFATHYPPFREAAWHEGKMSEDNWAPWFTSIVMGKMLEEVAKLHPENRITVLCGHTHGEGFYQHSDNLAVFTGAARYGFPDVNEVFELPIRWPVV